MSGGVQVTAMRARIAIAVAVLADLIQLPINLATLSGIGAIPAEAVDIVIDVATALMLSRLLGFHWALLPTAALELVPFIDAAPTWTACAMYVISRRKHEGRYVSDAG